MMIKYKAMINHLIQLKRETDFDVGRHDSDHCFVSVLIAGSFLFPFYNGPRSIWR